VANDDRLDLRRYQLQCWPPLTQRRDDAQIGQSAGNRLREVVLGTSKRLHEANARSAALSPSRVTDEANFGWRCWRRGCPGTRCGSGAGGVAQIAPGIDAFTRHTGLQRQQDPLVRLKLKKLPLLPSGPLNEPGGRAGDRNPEYRDADEPHSGGRDQQHSGLADDGGLKTALL
jgi:hypothetical protein